MSPEWRSKEWYARTAQLGHRALYRSMGYDSGDFGKPWIGVHNTWSETSPGHYNLRAVTEAVKVGIWEAGGTPCEFGGIAHCPVVMMGYQDEHLCSSRDAREALAGDMDTPSRDIVAMEVESVIAEHLFDGMVLVSSCDKIVPGHWMAAARLGIPAIHVAGGPMELGHVGKRVLDAADTIGIGLGCDLGNSEFTGAELEEIEDAACPTCGSCQVLGTANTGCCLSEAVGLALPGSATAPAVSSRRLRLARAAGRQIVWLVKQGITALDVLSPNAIRNMIMVEHALGGSSNDILHILALVEELRLGDRIDIMTIQELSDIIPCITNVRPSGTYGVCDLDEAGGVPAVMKQIQRHLHLDVVTVTGKTLGENLERARVRRPEVIRSADNPVYQSGLAILSGNLATSAVARPSVWPSDRRRLVGPARVFDYDGDLVKAVREHTVNPGTVLVLRYQGPRGGPGTRENFRTTYYLINSGLAESCAIVCDGKFSGFARGPFVCQVTPEAAVGGPLAVVQDGDMIEIDVAARKLELLLSDSELKQRLSEWVPREPRVKRGQLTLWERFALPNSKGGGLPLNI